MYKITLPRVEMVPSKMRSDHYIFEKILQGIIILSIIKIIRLRLSVACVSYNWRFKCSK